MAEDNVQVVTAWIEAHNAQDVDRMIALTAEDLTVRNTSGSGPGPRGRDQVAAFWTTFFATFPDHHMDLREVTIDGDRVFAEVVEDGTMDGPMGAAQPTGQHFSIEAAFRFDLTDGRISTIASYWDMGSVARQLDLSA